jgi:hypothetical protein
MQQQYLNDVQSSSQHSQEGEGVSPPAAAKQIVSGDAIGAARATQRRNSLVSSLRTCRAGAEFSYGSSGEETDDVSSLLGLPCYNALKLEHDGSPRGDMKNVTFVLHLKRSSLMKRRASKDQMKSS